MKNPKFGSKIVIKVAGLIALSNLSFVGLAQADCTDWPEQGVDWSKCRKTSKVMKSMDFRDANLEETNFYGSNLSKSNFVGANLYKVELSSARLTDAKLDGVDLRKSVGYRAKFDRASL